MNPQRNVLAFLPVDKFLNYYNVLSNSEDFSHHSSIGAKSLFFYSLFCFRTLEQFFLNNEKRDSYILPSGRKLKRELCRKSSKQTLLSTKTPKTQNELCFDGRKLKHELCRKTSKQTLRNTFYRGSPSLYYLQKLQKHRTNSVLMGEN